LRQHHHTAAYQVAQAVYHASGFFERYAQRFAVHDKDRSATKEIKRRHQTLFNQLFRRNILDLEEITWTRLRASDDGLAVLKITTWRAQTSPANRSRLAFSQ
jgi:hypothetical protein